MSATVKYKGRTIAEITENVTKTLKTSGKYCEADIVVENTKDGGGAITDGIVVKARDSKGYATEIDLYGVTIYPYTLGSTVNPAAYHFPLSDVTKCNFKSSVLTVQTEAFLKSKLAEAVLPPSVQAISKNAFRESSIVTAVVPSEITFSNGTYVFYECKKLQSCTLGAVGKRVAIEDNQIFGRCTQQGLTITIYTNGANVDAAMANIRNGATNATIIIKASEETTYNGTSYTAGSTIINSEVTA